MNPERIAQIALGGAAALVGALIALNLVMNPMTDRRDWLREELARVPATQQAVGDARPSYDRWRVAVTANPAVWRELVEPPPPPPPPPPPKPTCRPIQEDLKGVRVAKSQVGQRVMVYPPGSQRGEFMGVGDTLNGCTLEAIDRTHVTFTRWCKEEERTLTIQIPRD